MQPSSLIEKGEAAFLGMAGQRRVIFYYVGYFSQNVIAAMAEALKLKLASSGADGTQRRRLFSSFIEMAQNIVHYSSEALTPEAQDDRELRHGSVCITQQDGHYVLLCANIIRADDVTRLRTNLQPLRDMTADEIRQAHKRSLREPSPEGSKGAGLGFLTMAKDSTTPLAFDFEPLEGDAHRVMFYLKTTI